MGVQAGPFICDGLLFKAEHLVLPWIAERIMGMEGNLLASSTCPASAIGVLGAERFVLDRLCLDDDATPVVGGGTGQGGVGEGGGPGAGAL